MRNYPFERAYAPGVVRNRVVKLLAAIGLAILADSRAISAQADVASAWLARFEPSDVGVADLLAAGVAVQPILIDAAQYGPDAQLLRIIAENLGDEFDRSQAWLATHSGELGLVPADLAAARSVTRDEYIARGVDNGILAYRSRALFGLALVGDETGKQVVRSFAVDATSPLQSVAQAALQAADGGVDTTSPTVVPHAVGVLAATGWYTSDVVVTWQVADPESDIASSTGCEPTTLTADTSGVTLTCTATNGAGLSSAATITIKIQRALAAAIVSDDAVLINGVPEIEGDSGGIHTNLNMTISGNPKIAQGATASGAYTASGRPIIGGDFGGGRPTIAVPSVNAADHTGSADYVLTVGGAAGGRIRGPFSADGSLGPVILNCVTQPSRCKTLYGWEYDPGKSGWKAGSKVMTNGTYYVQGGVIVSGNPGEGGSPKAVTIIAEGSIEVSGNPRFQPDTPGLMFVTNHDLKLTGNMQMTAGIEGWILVGEQMQISGNPVLHGHIEIDNRATASNVVIKTEISGAARITYNGNAGSAGVSVTGRGQ